MNRHERVQSVLSAGGPAMSPGLRARLRTQPKQPAALRPRLALAAATALAAFGAALAIVLNAGSPAAPTVSAAAMLSARAATAPSPAQDARHPTLLRASFGGVTYPDWRQRFGWRTAGQRDDTIAGRPAHTVFYRHTHHRIGYTVVAGKPLKRPAGAQRLVVDGLVMYRYRDGRDTVVSFRRNGRTCVLAGYVHFANTLPKLAAWKGEGAIAF